MKVIIAGSRTFKDYNLLYKTLEEDNLVIDEIVCGGANGADNLGALYAKMKNYPIKYFIPNWDKYGKAAGMVRSHQMGDYADFLYAFWDGKSKGTKDMINYMQKINKHGRVVLFK